MNVNTIKRALRYIFKGVPVKDIKVYINQTFSNETLAGKRILVTGGSKGIGYYIAKQAILEGAKVLICARNKDSLIKAQRELGNSCKILTFDISDVKNMHSFFEEAFALLDGRIDCLVNNAGISYHEGSFRNVTEKGFDEQFSVNYKGSYFMAKNYIEMVEKNHQCGGNILFITSERGSFCSEIPYGLSKASIKSLVGSLSRNLYGKKNIRVNALAPGVTASDMTGHSVDGNYADGNSPIGRIFHPSEMASVACFLLSDNSSCISGETVHCDAGRHQSVIN